MHEAFLCTHPGVMPWQIAIQLLKRYFPQVVLPIAIVVGYIGYSIETRLRPPRQVEGQKSASERREERRLEEMSREK